MKRTPLLAITVVAVIGIAACSSDKKSLTAANPPAAAATTSAAGGAANLGSTPTTATATTQTSGGASGISIPGGAIPGGAIPGISGDCLKYAQAMASAFSGLGAHDGTQGLTDLGAAFAKLATVVPDNIKPDVKVLQDAYGTLGALYAKYNNDFSKIVADPQAQAVLGNPKLAAASSALSTWLSTSCKKIG